MKKKLVSLFLTLCMIVTLLPVQAFAAETVTVTTEVDLRAAVAVDGFSVTLGDDVTLTSDLEITASGTIDGGGHTLSGGTVAIPDWLDATVELAISNLTITNAGGRGLYIGWSGMDEDKFNVTMTNCTVTGCTAANGGSGGGIYNCSTLTMTDCAVTDCATTEYGRGGGIFNGGTLTMTGCSLLNNNASTASAIESFGHEPESEAYINLTDCVISGNTARSGASIRIECGGVLENCVVTGNTGTDPNSGGGIYHSGGMHSAFANGSLALNNCVVAGNYIVTDGVATQIDMIGEEPQLLTAVNSVVGVAVPGYNETPMQFGYVLNSSVNEAPALDTVFADVETKTVNGVEISVPTANSNGTFDLTPTYASMVQQPIPIFTKVETTRTSFTQDDYSGDMSRVIRVLSNVPCVSYFAWEPLDGSNYTEKGTTRVHELYLEGHAEEIGEKGPDFPVYYYIDREGYDPVVGHVVVSIEKLGQEAPYTDSPNVLFDGDGAARYLYHPNGPVLDFSFDGGLTWKHFPDYDDWPWSSQYKRRFTLSYEDFNTISPQYGIMVRWTETLFEYPSEPAVLPVTRQEQPPVTITQASAADGTATVSGLTSGMEASTDGASWTVCGASTQTLAQGETLYVRTRGGEPNLLPSLPLVLTAERFEAANEETPAAQIDFQSETLTHLTADADYFVNGPPLPPPARERFLSRKAGSARIFPL